MTYENFLEQVNLAEQLTWTDQYSGRFAMQCAARGLVAMRCDARDAMQCAARDVMQYAARGLRCTGCDAMRCARAGCIRTVQEAPCF